MCEQMSGERSASLVLREPPFDSLLTEDGSTANLGLFHKELDQLGANKDIKVNGHFVEKQDVPLAHESHAELNSATLAIADLVHVPVQVNIENLQQAVTTRLVPVSSNRVEEVSDTNVRTDNGVRAPFSAKVDDALGETSEGTRARWSMGVTYSGRVHEHILTEDFAVACLCEALSGKNTQECRLSG